MHAINGIWRGLISLRLRYIIKGLFLLLHVPVLGIVLAHAKVLARTFLFFEKTSVACFYDFVMVTGLFQCRNFELL